MTEPMKDKRTGEGSFVSVGLRGLISVSVKFGRSSLTFTENLKRLTSVFSVQCDEYGRAVTALAFLDYNGCIICI